MNISTRKVLDKSFTALAYSSLAAMAAAVVLFLFPIIYNGIGAVVFKATVEHEKFLAENLDYYLSESEKERIAKADARAHSALQDDVEIRVPPCRKRYGVHSRSGNARGDKFDGFAFGRDICRA